MRGTRDEAKAGIQRKDLRRGVGIDGGVLEGIEAGPDQGSAHPFTSKLRPAGDLDEIGDEQAVAEGAGIAGELPVQLSDRDPGGACESLPDGLPPLRRVVTLSGLAPEASDRGDVILIGYMADRGRAHRLGR